MVMKCGPVFDAVESLRHRTSLERIILLSPRGRRLEQSIVRDLAQAPDLACPASASSTMLPGPVSNATTRSRVPPAGR